LLAVEFWAWLCRVSWNPLFGAILGGVFGGVFALLGAIIGGRYVLRSMEEQRQRDRLAAGRASPRETGVGGDGWRIPGEILSLLHIANLMQ
jgi:hypothetical protein